MLRKSSLSPPATESRFQVAPLSFDCRITPLDPEAQITGAEPPGPGPENVAMLTPRKFVSIPLVCTDHCEDSSTAEQRKIDAPRTIKSGTRISVKSGRTARILTAPGHHGDSCHAFVAAAFRRASSLWFTPHSFDKRKGRRDAVAQSHTISAGCAEQSSPVRKRRVHETQISRWRRDTN